MPLRIGDGTGSSIGGADDEVPKEEVAIFSSCCGICCERGRKMAYGFILDWVVHVVNTIIVSPNEMLVPFPNEN